MTDCKSKILAQPFVGEIGTAFKSDSAEDSEIVLPRTLGDTAFSEDGIVQFGTINKINPDDLIGKKGAGIYKKMLIDEQVKAVVKFKRDAITSRDYTFEVDREKLGDDEADRRIAITEKTISKMKGKPVDLLNSIMTAMHQGFSITEKNFHQFDFEGLLYWGLGDAKLKPSDTFEFMVDDFGNITGFEQTVTGRNIKLDINKFIHHVQNPEFDLQYGSSELREAYRAWFSKDMTITFYNIWLERSAMGFKWIKTDTPPNTSAYKAIQSVLTNTVNGAGMILSTEDEFNVSFPASNGEAFLKAIDLHDLSIARALLVPNLMGITPAGQTGSFSQSDTQLEAFLWTLDQEASRLEETLNDQLFNQLGLLNFGDDDWPRIRFQPISDRRIQAIIVLWKDLVSTGAVKATETDEAHIRKLLDFPERFEDDLIDNSDTPSPTIAPDTPDETIQGETVVLDDPQGETDNAAHPKKDKMKNKAAFAAALKRVDFKVIQRTTEQAEAAQAEVITSRMFEMTKDVVHQVKVLQGQDTLEAEQQGIAFSEKDVAKLQKEVNQSLQGFWSIGQKNAENEIDKSKGLAFSMKINRDRLDFISRDFFMQKSFKVAGKLSDDAIAVITNEIANGVKGGKTFKQIEQSIYLAMGSNGFVNMDDYRQALGAAIDPNLVNPQARIDTMLRTNGFEAVNEARVAFFTDPELDGFVEGLEYSAIMDSRTTQICQHLDGRTYADDAEEWEKYKPPNHFNCRSLLIAVTEIDSWVASPAPTIEPQQGFA